jgi:amidohydrolase
MIRATVSGQALKAAIVEAVNGLADELETLSRAIHAHPELGHQEVKACAWLSAFLRARGFAVTTGVAGLSTAFRATLGTTGGPSVAILCEYDALPEIGHACGHNLIAAAGVGAAAALAAVGDRLPPGRVVVLGTPAEERDGGKVAMIQAGIFDDIDCAMMVHGSDRTVLHHEFLGIVVVTLEFRGRAAHASMQPWAGLNALDACVQTYTGVSMLRQQMPPDCRIHGVITSGGAAPNVIPEYAAAMFYVRAPSLHGMWALHDRVVACAKGAAQATGVLLTVSHPEAVYEPLTSSRVMLDLFADNLRAVGLEASGPIPGRAGSSDIGNVSQRIPTIHPMLAVAAEGTPIHTREFAEAAIAPSAQAGLLAGAKAMAMTAVDLLAEPERVERARAELVAGRGKPVDAA